MNTNEKICKWLGIVIFTQAGKILHYEDNNGNQYKTIDFLHDRNQQKWIEDELERREYYFGCRYDADIKKWVAFIFKRENEGRTDFKITQIGNEDKIKNVAFISAVEQLIDKTK